MRGFLGRGYRVLASMGHVREGEAIAWHVLQAAKVRGKPVHRVTFHEITPQAVKAALAAPGRLDMDLVNAQQAWLVRVGPSSKDKPDLKTEADAQAVVDALEGADYRVLKVKKQRKSRRPYQPYTTSTLQQDAANRLHWGADKTMHVAQEAHEAIRPTSSLRTPRALREHLTPDQDKLYGLIWRRFIASQ
ncbi:MAG: hypothetical protein GY832_38940, partial [Chloroflexi bacterium]|nr:hypothetical protein [Chloroflexota bacterium]